MKGGIGGGAGGPGFGGGGLGGNPGGFPAGGFPSAGSGNAGFGGIESPTERVIAGRPPAPGRAAGPPGPLAARPELALDSKVNEQIRRRAVHDWLAHGGADRPDDLKKWLYKEVLHADLDDPLLGLGGVLTENYPFAEEDRAGGAGKEAALASGAGS
jgi:hypothetical protein